ncbi:MAG TPA: EamA family transporter [Rubrivivax sp.]|nr:EamA family transporter [Burkholderiales bacterium]HNT39973.1 EamA family transporter [Rubrivivax sp.]
MTWIVVLAVMFAAALHAGWNVLVKSAGDKSVDNALITFLGGWVALPLALAAGLPQAAAWPYLAASLVVHVGYYSALAGAYHHGELGLTYPIMRGLAPLLVALVSAAVVGEVPAAATWAGVLAITLGVGLVGLAHPGQALHHGKAMAFAVANAAIIAAYTLVDGLGVRAEVAAGGAALRYPLWLFVINALPYPLLVLSRRDRAGRRGVLAYARARWPLAAVGGAASIGSYAIALWAMTRAPVASVAALRETSVLFAAALGTWMLRERFGWQRGLGTVAIVAGVVALRLA